MAGRLCCRDVLPFTIMVTMECVNMNLNTLVRQPPHVFIVYAYAIAALVPLPAHFTSLRAGVNLRSWNTQESNTVLQLLLQPSTTSHRVLHSSSPSSSVPNDVKGMESVALRKASRKAKVLGTVVSIAFAFVVTLYKGPPIFMAPSPSNSIDQPLCSPIQSWVLSVILLASECILVPLWYIVQTQIMKEHPADFTEGTSSAWIIQPNMALASIFCSGLFGSCLNNTVHTWALHLKGPVFVAMAEPLSIIIAVVMSVILLGDSLYLVSLIGPTIISIGFYTLMWETAKEVVGSTLLVARNPALLRKCLYFKAINTSKCNLCRLSRILNSMFDWSASYH